MWENTSYENITMDCPYAVKRIQDLKITRKINEHATLFITGIMPQEEQGKSIETAGTHDKVFIYKTNNQGEKVNILFAGVVTSLAIRHVQGIYYIEIEAMSYTFTLDVKEKSQSFQNKSMLYTDIIRQVLKGYKGAGYIYPQKKLAKSKSLFYNIGRRIGNF